MNQDFLDLGHCDPTECFEDGDWTIAIECIAEEEGYSHFNLVVNTYLAAKRLCSLDTTKKEELREYFSLHDYGSLLEEWCNLKLKLALSCRAKEMPPHRPISKTAANPTERATCSNLWTRDLAEGDVLRQADPRLVSQLLTPSVSLSFFRKTLSDLR